MQLAEPRVYYYETSQVPTREALLEHLSEDGADLGANVLGMLVQTPPETFFGVERYDVAVVYGGAYDDLVATRYRNRDGRDWLARGAKDDPQALVTNLQTTLNELEAGREPFAWQVPPRGVGQFWGPVGLSLLVLIIVALVVYRPFGRKGAGRKPAPLGAASARERLEADFLAARYAADPPLDTDAPEARYIRELLFGEDQPAHIYRAAETALGMPEVSEADTDLPGQDTPFDDDIRAAFEKLAHARKVKQRAAEECHYGLDKIAEADTKLVALQEKLRDALASAGEASAAVLLAQQRRLEDKALVQREQGLAYEALLGRLKRETSDLEKAQQDLLKQREVYSLVAASLELQRDLDAGAPLPLQPQTDIRETLKGVEDLIDAYMELSVPSYHAPSLPDELGKDV